MTDKKEVLIDFEKAKEIVRDDMAVVFHQLPAILSFELKSSEKEEDYYFFHFEIYFHYPENVLLKKHDLTINFNIEDAEYGIEYYSDCGELFEITPENILSSLYFDLALPSEETETPETPIVLTEDEVGILGRPIFACAKYAHLLIGGGAYATYPGKGNHKAEYEQAVFIHCAMDNYKKHGQSWSDEMTKILNSCADNIQKMSEELAPSPVE